jgi:predicted porin
LPLEVQRTFGPLALDAEVGYFLPIHGHEERIIGFSAGYTFTKKLEVMGEVYNDRAMGDLPRDTTWDFGGHYGFHKGLVLLFMAGRSFSGNSSGQPYFLSYVGVRILLERNGLALHEAE